MDRTALGLDRAAHPADLDRADVERRARIATKEIGEFGEAEPFGKSGEPSDVGEQDAHVEALRQECRPASLNLGQDLFRNELLEPLLDVVLPDIRPKLIIPEWLRQEAVDPLVDRLDGARHRRITGEYDPRDLRV